MNDRLLLYLVGPPGVGKSTVMAELTSRCGREQSLQPFAHDVLVRQDREVGVELGRRRASFSGTDALGMSVQPRAVEWIASRPHRLVLGEGARLGTVGFLTAARTAGYRVLLVHLSAPEDVLERRRALRGSRQSPSWMQGAETRAQRLADRMALDADVHRISGNAPAADLAEHITALDERLADLCSN